MKRKALACLVILSILSSIYIPFIVPLSLGEARSKADQWVYFTDPHLSDYVDVDGDGYYRSVTAYWDADVDQDVYVDVYIEAEGRDSNSIWHYLTSYETYTIYDAEVDYKSFTVEVPFADTWDIKLELYKWNGLPELVDDWLSPDSSEILMEPPGEDEEADQWVYFTDPHLSDYVDVDGDGYYRSVTAYWDADVDQDVYVDVYIEAERRDSSNLLSYANSYGTYTTYDAEVDYKNFSVDVPYADEWDIKLELYKWNGLPELVDDWWAYDILMESSSEDNAPPSGPDLALFEPEINDLVVTMNGVVSPGTLDTNIERIHWDWGDGDEHDKWFPACHTYDNYKTYTIKVTAYQSDGLTASQIKQVSLDPPGVGPTILILVNEDIYVHIREKLTIYEEDLRNEGYEILKRTVASETDPPEIKDIIKSCYLNHNVIGAILVGDINAAYCEIHTGDYSNPNALKIWISLDAADMYYMDLDGDWDHVKDPDFGEDAPPNVAECHKYPSCEMFKNEYIVYLDSEEKEWDYSAIVNKEQFKAEIWVSRIMAHNLDIPGKSEEQIINDFFTRNHEYRTKKISISGKAYLLNAINSDFQNMDFSGIFNTVVKKEYATKDDYLGCLEDPNGSELMYLIAHSLPQQHALYDTSITTSELMNKNKTSIFYILNSCSATRWDHYASEPNSPNYLGGLYVFDTNPDCKNYGLGAMGFTGVGGFNWLEYFTDHLNSNQDSSYGEAYKYWFNRNLMYIFGPNNYVYLGDPTIRSMTSNPVTITIGDLVTVWNYAALVLGTSEPYGPLPWGALIDDTIAAIDLVAALGDYGSPSSAFDVELAEWTGAGFSWKPSSPSSVIAIGGTAVNLISYEYNSFMDFSLSVTGQYVELMVDTDGIDYIRLYFTPSHYVIHYSDGRDVSYSSEDNDFAVVYAIYDSVDDKYVFLVMGMCAEGTIGACRYLAMNLESFPTDVKNALGIILRWHDIDMDRVAEGNEMTVVATYP